MLAVLWSPNLDVVALVTEDERLHFASGCDLLPRGSEDGIELHPAHFGRGTRLCGFASFIFSHFPAFSLLVAAQVNLGWGKKETQFHGSEGKAAAVRKAEVSRQE